MADTETCKTCKGSGVVDYLVSMHSDEKETSKCKDCNGKGKIHYMSDEDEADYHADYW
jgi:DnaJ-class molecular chaperone